MSPGIGIVVAMGIKGFEGRLERAVEGTFSRLFRSGLSPVEFGRKLVRDMDSHRTVGVDGRTLVPNSFVFRISPPSALEAEAFAPMVEKLGVKKVDFLVINNDWGRGAAVDFGKMLKGKGVQVGLTETMDAGAQDMSAQLAKIKGTDSDTLMITAAVDQLTLVFKQMAAMGVKKRVVTTGGSQNPDQILAQAGSAADKTMHLTTFLPWSPEKTPDPKATAYFLGEWKNRGYPFAGSTESFRGYDGIRTIAAAIEKAGSTDPKAIQKAFWDVSFTGLNGPIAFAKAGPEGKESGQSKPGVYLIEIADGAIGEVKL